MGTQLPAPVALPSCPLGALADPCARWDEEAAPNQPSQFSWALCSHEQPRNCAGVYSKKIIYQVSISGT